MKKIVILLSSVFMLSSCALIFTGTEQEVVFKSNAVDAKVYSNLNYIGRTNEEIDILRQDIPNLYTIKAEGCRDTSFVIPEKFNWVCIADALFAYPYMIDLALGVQYKTDEVIKVDLDCSENEK